MEGGRELALFFGILKSDSTRRRRDAERFLNCGICRQVETYKLNLFFAFTVEFSSASQRLE